LYHVYAKKAILDDWLLRCAGLAHNVQFAAYIRTIYLVGGLFAAFFTISDIFRFVRKAHLHTVIKHKEFAFPQAVVGELLAVLYDAAIYLIDLFIPTVQHHSTQNFAAYTTGTIGDYWLVFVL
jgi:hypothetical protein